MVTLVAEHWFKPESVDRAIETFRQYSERLSEGDSFASRLVLRSMSDPTKITTITTWETEDAYHKFMAELAKTQASRDPNAERVMLGERLEGYEVLIRL